MPTSLPAPVPAQVAAPGAVSGEGRTRAARPAAGRRLDPAALVGGTVRRLRKDWGDPLLRNGYALIVNIGVTSLLGLIYWILAARFYSALEVGLAVSAINLMQFLAGVGGQLSFQSALTRFIPHAGKDATRLALISYTLAGAAGALVSVLYLVGTHIPSLGIPVVLGKTWVLSVALGGSVTVWCVFALQDAVLTGIRQAVWIPIENGSYGVVKIIVLIGLARVTQRYGIFASWTIPAFVALFPVNWLIFGRLLPRHVAKEGGKATTVTARSMSRFMGGDYLGTVFYMGVGAVLPLLILSRLGGADAGYFGEAYVIVYALDLITVNLGVALMVEGAIDRTALRAAATTVVRRIALLIVPAVLVLVAFAPLVLSVFGAKYAQFGSTLLRLMALAVLFKAVTSLYIALSRVEKRVSRIALAQGTLFASIAGLSWWLMGHLGLKGVGVAYLASQAVMAAILLPAILRMLARHPASLVPAE